MIRSDVQGSDFSLKLGPTLFRNISTRGTFGYQLPLTHKKTSVVMPFATAESPSLERIHLN